MAGRYLSKLDIPVGVLSVNAYHQLQVQPGLVEADRPVCKSVQCQVSLKQKDFFSPCSFKRCLFEDGCRTWFLGVGPACVPRAPRWIGPEWGRQVDQAPRGRQMLLLLGLADRLPVGLSGPSAG